MKLLITGGAGFIGSEFTRQAVERGYLCVVVDKLTYAGDLKRLEKVRDRITFYKSDICDRDAIEEIFFRERPDVVVHWAAESHVDRSILGPEVFFRSNVMGTLNLLEAAKSAGVDLFVNIATDEVYGELGEDGRFTEESCLSPNSPYSVSKASADMLGRAYHRTYGLPVITVRPCNTYGPWQYPEKLIPVVIAKALRDEPVPVYGKGTNVREWMYVSDCAEAIFALIDKGLPGSIYNVGSGQERRNIEVVKAVLNLMGKPESLITFVKDRPGHDFRYSLDASKMENETGWRPKVSFEEGIERTVNWYLAHKEWLEEKVSYLQDYWQRVYKS